MRLTPSLDDLSQLTRERYRPLYIPKKAACRCSRLHQLLKDTLNPGEIALPARLARRLAGTNRPLPFDRVDD